MDIPFSTYGKHLGLCCFSVLPFLSFLTSSGYRARRSGCLSSIGLFGAPQPALRERAITGFDVEDSRARVFCLLLSFPTDEECT